MPSFLLFPSAGVLLLLLHWCGELQAVKSRSRLELLLLSHVPNPTITLPSRLFLISFFSNSFQYGHNVAFNRGTGWRGLCSAQTVTDRTVGYNAWLAIPL
jgi:hypothetical protein